MVGFSDAVDRVRGIVDRLADMTPVTRVIAADLQAFIVDRFQTSTSAVDGLPFRPLGDTTKQINPRRAGGKPLLDTGRLRSSVFARGTRRGVVFGTNVIYGPAQNFGNPTNRVFGKAPGPIPARPFLPVTTGLVFANAELLARFVATTQRWLETGELR